MAEKLTNLAKDAAYIAVGLGVLGFQKAQAKRVDVQKNLNLDERWSELRQVIESGIGDASGLVETATNFLGTSLEPIEDSIPPVVKEFASKAIDQAKELQVQITELVGSAF